MASKVKRIDIARKLGVNVSTVSRVLNNRQGIGAELRDKILTAAAEQLADNDTPANTRAAYKTTETIQIAALLPELGNSFFSQIIAGAEDVTYDAQAFLRIGSTAYQPQREQQLVKRCLSDNINGLIIWPSRQNLDHCRDFFRPEVPIVTVDRAVPNDNNTIGSVIFDDYDGAGKAAEYIINLGHRHIGFIEPMPVFSSLATTQNRVAALKDAMTQRGIDENFLRVQHCEKGEDYGYSAAMQLCCSDTPPTAIFLNDDAMAPGACAAFRRLGLKVGQDIAVVGFGDQDISSQLEVPLTTVRQNMKQLGKIATDMLLEKIRNPLYNLEKIVLPAPLVIRSSCCPPAEKKHN